MALGDTFVYSTNSSAWVLRCATRRERTGYRRYQRIQGTKLVVTGTPNRKPSLVFPGIVSPDVLVLPRTPSTVVANDELNIIVYDATGNYTGTKGNTLETYFGVSKLAGATTQEGDNNYYIDVINNRSGLLFANHTLMLSAGGYNSGRDCRWHRYR